MQDDMYVAQHVTGPTHNMLRLKLTQGPPADFTVNVLPAIGDCRNYPNLAPDEVMPAIRAGIARANAQLGTDFSVELAEIVENDSPQPAVYEYLARRIVERAAEGTPP